MENTDTNQGLKRLYTLAMANASIWGISLVALIILLEGNGNPRGLYVILAGGMAVAIQLMSLISKLRRDKVKRSADV